MLAFGADADPLDDARRRADRPRREGRAGRPRRGVARRAPPGRRRASSATPPRPPRRCSRPASASDGLPRHARARSSEIAAGSWRDEPFEDAGDATALDPRTLSIALDALLPAERTVAVDSGHFMGFPPMYLRVPDAAGFVFTQAFQSIGLGLASAIGAAVARPDRLTVACLGDGGALMALPELETLARLRCRCSSSSTTTRPTAPRCTTSGRRGIRSSSCASPTPTSPRSRAPPARRASPRARSTDLDAVGAWLERRDGPLVRRCEGHPRLLRGMARGGLQVTKPSRSPSCSPASR